MLTPTDLKQRRRKLGLSQKAFGKLCGVHYMTVWRYEDNQWCSERNAILFEMILAQEETKNFGESEK